MVTVASFANSWPVIVTVVPPLVLPTFGEIAVTWRPMVGAVPDFVAQAPASSVTRTRMQNSGRGRPLGRPKKQTHQSNVPRRITSATLK